MKINQMDSLQQLMTLKEICNKIYIARNISLNHESVLEQLEEIDKLFKEDENHN